MCGVVWTQAGKDRFTWWRRNIKNLFNKKYFVSKKLIICLIFIKLIGIFYLSLPDYDLKRIIMVNNDEMLIAEVAINYRNGLGFVSSGEIINQNQYNVTSLRPSFPVFLHIGMQNLYHFAYPTDKIICNKLHSYFLVFGFLLQLTAFCLYLFSLVSVYKIAEILFNDRFWSNTTLLFYGLYPSVLLYVGNQVGYESIAMSLIILAFYQILQNLETKLSTINMLYICFLSSMSILIRPQTLFVFAVLLLVFIGNSLLKQKLLMLNRLFLGIIFLLFFLFTNLPALIKNKELTGEYNLGSQSGYSFFEGHNPFARGSWCGDCGINPQKPVYQFIRQKVKNYDLLTEKQQSDSLKTLANNWIKENPLQELVLIARKVAIYFLPYNSENMSFNIFNLIVHLGFFAFLWNIIFYSNSTNFAVKSIIIAPVLGSLLVSILFFVGYRWRYYAEPFMIFSFVFILKILVEKYLQSFLTTLKNKFQ